MVTKSHLCDLCGATESVRLHTLQDVVHHAPGSYEVRQCRNCGLTFLSPQPEARSLGELYPGDYDCHQHPGAIESAWPVRYMRQRRLASQRRMVVRRSRRQTGVILDVGCSTGLFLAEMARHGWQALGIEPVAGAARTAAREYGLRVIQATLAEADMAEGSLDVVTYWQVLEHTRSPRAELQRIHRLLKPGGLFLATVPNYEGFDRRVFGHHWQGYDCPRHLFAFDRRTLAAYLSQTGFEYISTSCSGPGYYAMVPSVVRAMSASNPSAGRTAQRLLLLPGLRFLFEPFIAAADLLGRGPILLAAAVKPT